MNVIVPAEVESLRPWVDAGVLGSAEVHAAAVVARLLRRDGSLFADDRVVLAFALALWAPSHGHSCFDLDTVAGVVADTLTREAAEDEPHVPDPYGDRAPVELPWPEPRGWRRALLDNPAVRVAERTDDDPVLDNRPLVISGPRVYTQRQWADECAVTAWIQRAAAAAAPDRLAPAARAVLATLLPAVGAGSTTQHLAAAAVLDARFAVIVGGPGTGKTYTTACALVSLVAGSGVVPPRIGLAAPTGKAAARMTEAVAAIVSTAIAREELPGTLAERLGELRAVTVHRLLGPRPDHRSRFVYHRGNPLPYDVVVVDETSMLSLGLMARLLEAVPDSCRLVLVGDPDQLRSIDSGAVIGDLVRAADDHESPLHRHVVRLTTQHRTGLSSPIIALSDAVRRGRADEVLGILRAGDAHDRLSFVEVEDLVPSGGAWPPRAAVAAVRDAIGAGFVDARAAAQRGAWREALVAIGQGRILCGHRRGHAGVEDWNRHVESWLLERPGTRRDYSGRAVLATRNDPRTGIANGDTGVLVRGAVDGEPGPLRAVFQRGDSVRSFSLPELDDLDTAFAMTIHKSQGSEYDTVVVVHPPPDSPLATRELLYTAITRASRRLVIVGSAASIRRAVETPSHRVTGLQSALRGTA